MLFKRFLFFIFHVLLLGLLVLNGLFCLKITDFKVPERTLRGESIIFVCLYDLEDDRLYSLKWYKNETEFYRYEPNGLVKVQIFPIPEINLDATLAPLNYSQGVLKKEQTFTRVYTQDKKPSNGTFLAIRKVDLDASGNYKCEVSADGSFLTVQKEQMMMVLARATHLQHHKPLFFTISTLTIANLIVTML